MEAARDALLSQIPDQVKGARRKGQAAGVLEGSPE